MVKFEELDSDDDQEQTDDHGHARVDANQSQLALEQFLRRSVESELLLFFHRVGLYDGDAGNGFLHRVRHVAETNLRGERTRVHRRTEHPRDQHEKGKRDHHQQGELEVDGRHRDKDRGEQHGGLEH